MKFRIKLFTFLSIGLSPFLLAQVAIGKSSLTNASVSLEFGTATRGIILPYVNGTAAAAGAVAGTIIFDAVTKNVAARMGSGWQNLSSLPGSLGNELDIQNTKTERAAAKTVIGPTLSTDTTPGILVLSATNQAMILPKVNKPYDNIGNPAPGMMVYDTATKKLALFNGSVWTFMYPQ